MKEASQEEIFFDALFEYTRRVTIGIISTYLATSSRISCGQLSTAQGAVKAIRSVMETVVLTCVN